MRDVILFGTRLVVGSYLAVHGAQKLFGAFGGGGLDKTAAGFEHIGLTPGRPMATIAGVTELGGGVLTIAGVADPAGPLAIMGAMSVAATTHRANGPLAANRGFELPLTNLAAAAALAVAGPGRIRLSPPLRRELTALVVVGGAAMAAASVARMLTASRDQAAKAQPPATPQDGAANNGAANNGAANSGGANSGAAGSGAAGNGAAGNGAANGGAAGHGPSNGGAQAG
jgi:putative oxidoreductase